MINYRISSPGSVLLLRSLHRPVNQAAAKIAQSIRQQKPGARVVVDRYETDRAAAAVVVLDPRAQVWAVRDGIFQRAAATAGLTVTDRHG